MLSPVSCRREALLTLVCSGAPAMVLVTNTTDHCVSSWFLLTGFRLEWPPGLGSTAPESYLTTPQCHCNANPQTHILKTNKNIYHKCEWQ